MKKCFLIASTVTALGLPLVQAQANLQKVTQKLDMDGAFFMASNVENDLSKIAKLGNDLLATARANGNQRIPKELDLTKVLTILGADQIVAYGRSAKFNQDHWTNKMYLQTGGSNKGLLSYFGEKAKPFGVTQFAPEGTDMALDLQLDYRQAVAITKALSAEVKCEHMEKMAKWPEKAITQNSTWGDVANQLQLQLSLAVKLDDTKRETCPIHKEYTFPKLHVCSRIKGINPIWKQFQPMSGFMFKIERLDDGTRLMTPLRMPKKMQDKEIILHMDEKNDVLWIANSKAFLQECQAKGKKLGQDPAFNAIAAGNGRNGNGLAYISHQACLEIRQVKETKRAKREKKYFSDEYFKFMLDHVTESKNGYFASMAKTNDGIQLILQAPCPIKEVIAGGHGMGRKGCGSSKGCGCNKGKAKASPKGGCPMKRY